MVIARYSGLSDPKVLRQGLQFAILVAQANQTILGMIGQISSTVVLRALLTRGISGNYHPLRYRIHTGGLQLAIAFNLYQANRKLDR